MSRWRGLSWVVGGALLWVAAWVLRGSKMEAFGHEVLVEDRVAECIAHHDEGYPGYSRQKLQSAERRFHRNLKVGIGAVGLACVVMGGLGLLRRTPTTALAFPLLAATFAAVYETTDQVSVAFSAFRQGVFTESEEEHQARFFDRSVAAADAICAVVPPGGRFLITNFASPNDVGKVGYLTFPRRMYMLPNSSLRTELNELRDLVKNFPGVFEWARERGYTHAVDLSALILENDASAIVPLTGEAR